MSATTRKLEAGLFGHETELEYSERWVGHSIVIMRVVWGVCCSRAEPRS